jgi:phage terminase large subunit-like protein
MPKKREDSSLESILQAVATGIGNSKPNHNQYKPHDRQVAFHSSQANGRQFLGGNRSGKTVAGINEDIMWALGRHKFGIDVPPPPIFGRICTVDFKDGAYGIIIPQLTQWLPPSALINGSWEDSWDSYLKVLTLDNGSQIEIRSYEQELSKFAGVPRHFTHFDEEPPYDIFKECKARLADYNGRWWMTMTPVDGMTWTYNEIYEKRDTNLIDVFEVDQDDNPFLSEMGRKNLQEGYDEVDRTIRARGRYIAVSGLCLPHYSASKHVIKPTIPPNTWTHYRSLDHGLNNPTAVYWHAVDPKTGTVITYREHYRSDWTIEQHATFLREDEKILRDKYGIVPFLSVADPAIRQRNAVTGLSVQIEYANRGINWALGNNEVGPGIDKMDNYFRLNKWFITEDCPNLQREAKGYRWAQYATSKLREKNNKKEEPMKKDDHGLDSSRYFFTFMPTLDIEVERPQKRDTLLKDLLGTPVRVRQDSLMSFDPNLGRKSEPDIAFVTEIGEY